MDILKTHRFVLAFIAFYLSAAAVHFAQDSNLEFVIYVGVIVAAFTLLFGTLKLTKFPPYILWLIAVWGLMHILGGAVQTPDGVLFAYRIYPFLDQGGDFYILKYDQVVHGYLYGVMALVFFHVLEVTLRAVGPSWVLYLTAAMASMGVSAMNEIMEFLIAVNLERHGVGGYENAMLDLVFNFFGAVLALGLVYFYRSIRR